MTREFRPTASIKLVGIWGVVLTDDEMAVASRFSIPVDIRLLDIRRDALIWPTATDKAGVNNG